MGGDNQLMITVKDSNLFKDEEIGTGIINIDQLFNKGRTSQWVSLFYNDKKAGDILLDLELFSGTFQGQPVSALSREQLISGNLSGISSGFQSGVPLEQ